MLKISGVDIFTIAIPEGFIYMLAMHVLGHCPIKKKNYLITSGFLALMIYIVRLLPISYGIHTILLMGIAIAVGMGINKLSATVVIRTTTFTVILQMISEGLVMFVTERLVGEKINQISQQDAVKVICSISSLFILLSIILIIGRVNRKKVREF